MTNAAGGFALPIAPPAVTTQYRARLATSPGTASAILTLPVAVRVTRTSRSATAADGVRVVRFSGSILPARDGAQFAVQRRSGTRWVTVGARSPGTRARRVRYELHVRVRHSGTYRVYVRIVDGNLVSATGREVPIRLR